MWLKFTFVRLASIVPIAEYPTSGLTRPRDTLPSENIQSQEAV
jgi:hypothetical protein